MERLRGHGGSRRAPTSKGLPGLPSRFLRLAPAERGERDAAATERRIANLQRKAVVAERFDDNRQPKSGSLAFPSGTLPTPDDALALLARNSRAIVVEADQASPVVHRCGDSNRRASVLARVVEEVAGDLAEIVRVHTQSRAGRQLVAPFDSSAVRHPLDQANETVDGVVGVDERASGGRRRSTAEVSRATTMRRLWGPPAPSSTTSRAAR